MNNIQGFDYILDSCMYNHMHSDFSKAIYSFDALEPFDLSVIVNESLVKICCET
jgi:hypothetical protein